MIPQRLNLGDTIGIVSPAGPESEDKIKQSIIELQNMGFNVKEGQHVYDKWGYLAGTDKDRADDIMNMFLDKHIKMILCVRGGYGTMRILPFLDFNIIKENPKIFAGFSDITTILNSIVINCNLISFHSPMCNSNFNDQYTLKSFLDTIMLGYKPYIIQNPIDIPVSSVSDKDFITGQLIGGNLSLICSTLSTPFEINTKNKILFIEEVGEEPYKIDRMITQLILSRKLLECRAIILGQFTNCKLPHYERSFTLEQIIEDRILSLNKPTLINIQSGHSYPKLTLPIGAKIRIDFKKGMIKVLEAVVY